MGAGLWPFDGDLASLEATVEASNRKLPFAVAKARPRVLGIGSLLATIVSMSWGFRALLGADRSEAEAAPGG